MASGWRAGRASGRVLASRARTRAKRAANGLSSKRVQISIAHLTLLSPPVPRYQVSFFSAPHVRPRGGLPPQGSADWPPSDGGLSTEIEDRFLRQNDGSCGCLGGNSVSCPGARWTGSGVLLLKSVFQLTLACLHVQRLPVSRFQMAARSRRW